MALNYPKTSFIPKRSLTKKPDSRRDTSVHWFMAIALLFVLAAATSYGALFLYKSVMVKRIESMAESLQRARDAFETNLITELQRVDARLSSADGLLSTHVAITPLFVLLEVNTVETVRFTNMNYEGGKENKEGKNAITMRGEARDFASIALQSDIFSENRYIQNHIFSNLNLDNKGNVTFDFSANVDPAILSYQNLINELEQGQF